MAPKMLVKKLVRFILRAKNTKCRMEISCISDLMFNQLFYYEG